MMRSTTIRICAFVLLSFALTAGAGLSTVEAKTSSTATVAKVEGKERQQFQAMYLK